MIFISAQPDTIYFHWQVELYLYQFSKHGIIDKCYAIFGYKGDEPSAFIRNLAKKYKNIFCYKDERNTFEKNHYISSIRPHILKKFFKDYPELGKNVFYHDSDILLIKMPKFNLLLNDNIAYLSDTISYIGYNYIISCAKRYIDKYPILPENDIFTKMCGCVGIQEHIVKDNEKNSGGAQYLLKNITSDYWSEVEENSIKLFDLLKNYEHSYPIDHHIQSWTADMWAVLWTYWKHGGETRIHDELNFSWATWSMNDFLSKNIFHLAGVTEKLASDKFFKGKFTNKNVFKEYLNDKTIFDHVSKENATFGYVNLIKEYLEKNPDEYPSIYSKKVDQFEIKSSKIFDGIYIKDEKKTYFNKPSWRSNSHIIFHNTKCWILTHLQYENEISEKCGGFATNSNDEPYERDGWNQPCMIFH